MVVETAIENRIGTSGITIRIQLQNKAVPIIALSGLLLFFLDHYRGWFMVFMAFGTAWLVGYLWVRSLAANLSLTREMRFGWAQVGDRLEERFILKNAGWAPCLWVEVIYACNMPDYMPGRVTSVNGQDQISWRSSGICTIRGEFTLGPVTLRSTDPFGIYQVEVDMPQVARVLVAPPVVPLPSIQIAPGGRTGEAHLRPFRGETTVAASGVRLFVPGDDIRRVHWGQSARHWYSDDIQPYYVRQMDHPYSSDWWVFLDLDEHWHTGKGASSSGEHGVILCASIIEAGIRERGAVGLAINGERFTWLPPQGGAEGSQKMQRALANAALGETSLADVLARSRRAIRDDASLILITPTPANEWIETLLPLLRTGAAPTVLFLNRGEYAPTEAVTAGELASSLALLGRLGIHRYVVQPGWFNRPEARPGKQGHWEWAASRSSRAVLARGMGDMEWREIT